MSRTLDRVRRLLARPEAWIDQIDNQYALRLGPDRRTRVTMRFDESIWQALVAAPGLKPRRGGGWRALPDRSMAANPPPPGCPGVIDGQRWVTDETGRDVLHRVNLAPTAIAWLAARRDAQGQPWLTPLEVAAGMRLSLEAERAFRGPALTASWDAPPRSGSARPRPVEPSDRTLDAARRVEQALAAVGPIHRPMLEAICVHGTALGMAETRLDLRPRTGKHRLKAALLELAAFYGG